MGYPRRFDFGQAAQASRRTSAAQLALYEVKTLIRIGIWFIALTSVSALTENWTHTSVVFVAFLVGVIMATAMDEWEHRNGN